MLGVGRRRFTAGLAATFLPFVARSSTVWSDLELCLGFDVSGSMMSGKTQDGRSHAQVQKQGYTFAFSNPAIRQSLIDYQTIVRIIVWSGDLTQLDLSDGGFLVKSDSDVDRLDQLIRNRVPEDSSMASGTSHYRLLQYVNSLPRPSARLVLDISTDERPTQESVCAQYRDQFFAEGSQINALAIDGTKSGYVFKGCKKYLQTQDGFTLKADSFDVFERSIEKKLLRELNAV